MTRIEYAKINTYNAISSVFATYAKDMEFIPLMPEIAIKFQSLQKELNSLTLKTGKEMKVHSKAKKQIHDILVKKLLSMNYALSVSAKLNNENLNRELLISESRLQLKKENELIAEATWCVTEAKFKERQLIPALIHALAIKELQKATEEYVEISNIIKDAGKIKLTINQQIRDKMKELDAHIRDKVDLIMPLYKQQNPKLFSSYREARRVKNKLYSAHAIFSDMILQNTTQTIADIGNQPHNWLLIKNKSNTGIFIFLSMIKDIALGEGVSVPSQSTIYRQVKNLNPDIRAKYLIVKNDDKNESVDLEIWMG